MGTIAEQELSASEAREKIADVIGRVSYGHERVVITRNGKPAAAVVTIEDLERLRALDQAKGMQALKRVRAQAASAGLDRLNEDQIQALVADSRAKRKRSKQRA